MSTSSLGRQVLFLLSGRMVAFAFMFFLPVVLARLFTQHEFGLYRQFFLIFYAVYTIMQFGMSVALPSFIPRHKEDTRSILSMTLIFLGAIGLFLTLVGGVVALLYTGSSEFSRLFLVLGVFSGLMVFTAPFESILLIESRSHFAGVLVVVWDIGRGALLLFTAILTHDLALSLWFMTIAGVLRAVGMLLYFRKRYQIGFSDLQPSLFWSQLKFAGPLTLQALAHLVEINVDRYVIMAMFTTSMFAVYTVGAFQIPIVDMVFSSVCGVVLPRLSEFYAAKQQKELLTLHRETIRRTALLLFPVFGVFFLVRSEFILFLFSAKYAESVAIFSIFVWLIPTFAFLNGLMLQAVGHERFLTWTGLLKPVFVCSFAFIGLSWGGMLGVVLGMVLYHYAATALHVWLTAKGVSAPISEVYPIRALFHLALVILGLVVVIEWIPLHSLPILARLLIKPTIFVVLLASFLLSTPMLTISDRQALKDTFAPMLRRWFPWILDHSTT